MSEGVPAASTNVDVTLVDLESELEALLVEYEPQSQAWPKEPGAVARAEIGRNMEDALTRIGELQYAIATTPARTVPEAAVHLRRLAALFGAWDNSLRRLLMPDNNDGETARYLLASALAAVETAEAPTRG